RVSRAGPGQPCGKLSSSRSWPVSTASRQHGSGWPGTKAAWKTPPSPNRPASSSGSSAVTSSGAAEATTSVTSPPPTRSTAPPQPAQAGGGGAVPGRVVPHKARPGAPPPHPDDPPPAGGPHQLRQAPHPGVQRLGQQRQEQLPGVALKHARLVGGVGRLVGGVD